jgi:LCP family protein required for cell wall assembly
MPSVDRPNMLVWLGMLIIISLVAACSAGPAPTAVVAVPSLTPSPSGTPVPPTVAPTAVVTTSPSPIRSPTVTPTATLFPTAPPTVVTRTSTPAALPPVATRTPTPTAPSKVATYTPAPTTTVTQSLTYTLTATPTPFYTPTPAPTVAFGEDVVNIVLIGLDSTFNLRGQNSDVIIVVSVNKDTKQVSMLSIPRDLWVYIPTYGMSRINTAHRRGYSNEYPGEGPALLRRTIELALGLPIQHWARVDFEGFAKVVDELGGVTVTVACPINLRYKAPTSEEEEEMILQPGVYQMDGATALRYVRTRRGSSDFDRARRQQQFLKAMWNQFKSPDLILKLPGLWSALKGSVTTDLSLGDLISLAGVGIEIKPQRVHSYYIGANETQAWVTEEGWQVLLPKEDKIQALVSRLASPPTTSADVVANEGAVIEVLNGTIKPSLDQFAVDQLQWYGLKIAKSGTAAKTDYAKTQIVVYNDYPKAVSLLASILKVKPEQILYQQGAGPGADIRVILGADYDPCQ